MLIQCCSRYKSSSAHRFGIYPVQSVVALKRESSPKKEYPVTIYSSSCCSKPTCCSLELKKRNLNCYAVHLHTTRSHTVCVELQKSTKTSKLTHKALNIAYILTYNTASEDLKYFKKNHKFDTILVIVLKPISVHNNMLLNTLL